MTSPLLNLLYICLQSGALGASGVLVIALVAQERKQELELVQQELVQNLQPKTKPVLTSLIVQVSFIFLTSPYETINISQSVPILIYIDILRSSTLCLVVKIS